MCQRRSADSADSADPGEEPPRNISSNAERLPLLLPESGRPAHEQPARAPRSPHPFTRRALCLGLVLGSAGSAMNTFFGLRTGSITGYSIPFAFIAKHLCTSLTNAESALIITVAVTIATAPMVAASLGVIPAWQFLMGPREGGPVVLTAFRHIVWAQSMAYFPLFFAMPFREQFLNQDGLPFPSATATAMIIDEKATRDALPQPDIRSNDAPDTASETGPNRLEHVAEARLRPENAKGSRLMTFFIPVGLSAVYTILSRLIPGADIVHCVPILAKDCWYLDVSPGVIGLGMIAGPTIAYDMFVSTLFGWGFLAWLSRQRGWVSGHTGDWKGGFRGWIIWPGLAALLADCFVSVLGSVFAVSCSSRAPNTHNAGRRRDGPANGSEESPEAVCETPSCFWEQATDFMTAMVSPKAAGFALVVIILLCPVLVDWALGNKLTWAEIFGAFLLALLLSYMAIQATGRTDTTPASALAKVSQFAFALSSDSDRYAHHFLINLVAGAIAEAGAVQAADLLPYQKLGRLLNVSASVLFGGQLLGSFIGGFFAVFWYWLFTSGVSSQRGADESLGLPAAHIWYATAQQALKFGLPRSASTAAGIAGALFLLLAVAKLVYGGQCSRCTRSCCPRMGGDSSGRSGWIPPIDWVQRDWLALFPAGSSFAVAMNNVPSVTMAWSLGGLTRLILACRGLEKIEILLVGSGLMLGEGLAEMNLLVAEQWLSLTDKHVLCSMKC